jgi:hypothetical protein
MVRNRALVVLGGCLLAASAAWADGAAYVDCASHPEVTLVFGKPRRTPETVASINCGERFTILQYGFIFSRIQTSDGQVGYIYSNLISADRSGAAVAQPVPSRLGTTISGAPAATPAAAQPAPVASAQPQPAAQVRTEAPASASRLPNAAAAEIKPNSTSAAATQTVAVQAPAPQTSTARSSVQETATASVTPSSSVTVTPSTTPATTAAVSATSSAATAEQTHAAPTQLAATEAAASTAGGAETSAPAASAGPEATPGAQPEAAAEAATPAIHAVRAEESWEKPNPSVRTVGLPRVVPLIELFGGYGFARFDNGGGASSTNLNGVIGSFGWNFKPWLQIVADSSYNFVTVGNVKTVLYGNHWGPRIFYRVRNRWGLTPFVEGFVGGTRADVTVSGAGGYKTSDNVISYKVGGGLDIKPSRHFEIRLFDVDYYRTSFGTNLYQNNYWASAGIVVRLFGGSE